MRFSHLMTCLWPCSPRRVGLWLRSAVVYGLLLIVALPMVHAAPMIELDPAKQPIALGDAGEFWIDTQGTDRSLQPAQIIGSNDIACKP